MATTRFGMNLSISFSVVLLEIHSAVQTRHLLAVTVEHQSWLALLPDRSANHSLCLLAPAGMIDVGIHVRIKTVFVRRHVVTCRMWLFIDKFHFHDRLR